ncbi:hypothetical protein AC579_7683 [Pseudocercospora musae]|uniref:Uncharacterized protein n=1 Tax=Pseudocercospora musae TaxID=113226 RepID=A0A139IB28_9PEZI|nr:hypothetical protein AC579_7683 [Pseudocercospora musae]
MKSVFHYLHFDADAREFPFTAPGPANNLIAEFDLRVHHHVHHVKSILELLSPSPIANLNIFLIQIALPHARRKLSFRRGPFSHARSRASVNARSISTHDFKQHHLQEHELTLLTSARRTVAVDMNPDTSPECECGDTVTIRSNLAAKKDGDMAKTTFFDFPLAIRKKIYTFAGIVDTSYQLRVCYGKHKDRHECSIPSAFTTLTKVTKQVRAEVSKLFFKRNEFSIFDCKHELITRKDCVCPIIMPQMRKFTIYVHYYVRAKIWKEPGCWKAKLVVPQSVEEEWLVNTGREFRPNRELEMFMYEGEKVLEVFRRQVAREDAWGEKPFERLLEDMDEIDQTDAKDIQVAQVLSYVTLALNPEPGGTNHSSWSLRHAPQWGTRI